MFPLLSILNVLSEPKISALARLLVFVAFTLKERPVPGLLRAASNLTITLVPVGIIPENVSMSNPGAELSLAPEFVSIWIDLSFDFALCAPLFVQTEALPLFLQCWLESTPFSVLKLMF